MEHSQLFRNAQEQLARGQVEAAIESLASLLGEDPDSAEAHALLAICLVRRKRLHAARLEAERSLELEPDHVSPHLAAASVASADRRFRDAERHLRVALELDPESADTQLQLAQLYRYWGRLAEAEVHAERARALAPDQPDALAFSGELALSRGDRDEAVVLATRSLSMDPEHLDSLVLLGNCELAAGRAEQARDHAVWALQLDPMDRGALELLCAVKARQSLWLGLWWRFQSFVAAGSRARTILLLLGMFLLYRAAGILLQDAGRNDIHDVVRVLWLAFCVYTWVAPEWFLRLVRKEIEEVRLKPGF